MNNHELVTTDNVTVAEMQASIKEAILSGDHSEIHIYVQLKRIQKTIEKVLKDTEVKSACESSFANNIEGKSAIINNATVTEGATYTKYHFDECGHSELDFIDKAIAALTKRKIDIETILKTINEGDTEDILITSKAIKILESVLQDSDYGEGEVVECKAPFKQQTIGLKVTTK